MNQIVKADQLFNLPALIHIKEHLIQHNESVSVAESVTSGLVQAAFGSTKDAAKFYQGGITAFNVGQKYRHLLIEPIHALSCNCISQQVAESMALNVCKLFQSDWGTGVTGYASPVPEGDNKLFAYYAISYKNKVIQSEKVDAVNDEPFMIQLEYANKMLEQLSTLMNTAK